MDNIEFKKIVQEITSKYEVMYCKKNYYYNSDKIIVVINLQKSNFDNSYYINISNKFRERTFLILLFLLKKYLDFLENGSREGLNRVHILQELN